MENKTTAESESVATGSDSQDNAVKNTVQETVVTEGEANNTTTNTSEEPAPVVASTPDETQNTDTSKASDAENVVEKQLAEEEIKTKTGPTTEQITSTGGKRTANEALFGAISEFERETKIASTVFSSSNTFSTFAASKSAGSLFSQAGSSDGASIFAKASGPIFGAAAISGSNGESEPASEKSAAVDVFAKQTTSVFGAPPTSGDGDSANGPTPSMPLPPTVVQSTGEEDERNLHQVHGKLYRLHKGSDDEPAEWKELGAGQFKINCSRGTTSNLQGQKPRMVMRQSGVFKLLLNARIWPGMVVEKVQEKMVRFACDSRVDQPGASNDAMDGFATFLLKLGRREVRNEVFDLLKSLSLPLEGAEKGDTEKSTSQTSQTTTANQVNKEDKSKVETDDKVAEGSV